MKRLLAVAVQEDWVGDWYPVRRDEQRAVAHPVIEGERVMLEVEHEGGATEFILLPAELDIKGWLRYRVVKRCDAAVEPGQTTVELFTHETHGKNRDAANLERRNGQSGSVDAFVL